MRRFLAALVALIFMAQGAALAGNILFTENDYEISYDYRWNFTIGQYGGHLYVFFGLSDHGVDTRGYSMAQDLTQPIVPLAYELDSDLFYNYFPSGDRIGAFYFSEDGYMHICDVTFDEGNAISHEEIAAFDSKGDEMDWFYPSMPVLCGNFFICASFSETGAYSLYTLDMDAGRISVMDTDSEQALLNVVGICPYDEKSVLVAAQDIDLSAAVSFYLYTPEEKALDLAAVIRADKPDIAFSTPAYDSETDTVYYIADGALCAMTGFDTDAIRTLPDYKGECVNLQSGQAFVSAGGYYVVSDGATVCAARTDPDAVVAPVISGLTLLADETDEIYNAVYAYGRANEGAEVNYITERPVGSDISADIIARSGAIDLYMLRTGRAEYTALADRGYLFPIESEKIQGFVDRMYPQMRDVITRDGKALALPVQFSADSIAYNPAAFAALGLTERDVPKTWMDLLALLRRMPGLVADTDYTVFSAWLLDDGMRGHLADAIVREFCQLYVRGEAAEAEQLRALLAELEQIDFYSMGLSSDRDNRKEEDDERTVFSLSMSIGLRRDDGYYQPMPLALEEGAQAAIDAELEVFIINPYSENKEAATAFLETLLDYVPATVQASVCADWEGGVKQDGADENLLSAEEEIAMIQAELDAATDEGEIEQYQTMLEDAIAGKEWLMARFYWEVSPELLSAYQARAESIRITRYIGLDYSEVIWPIVNKYLEGGSTLDAMVADLVNKLNIAANE
jgi:spermidine/putrescine-binding protein